MSQKGAVAVLVGLVLVVLCIFGALAIDISMITLTKAELQRVSDAASLAGCRRLGLGYETGTISEADITLIAQDTAYSNVAAGKKIEVADDDVQVGHWDFDTRTFTSPTSTPNAVKVQARRDNKSNSPMPTFLARIFNKESVEVTAVSIACIGSSSEGKPLFPVGISEQWFKNKELFCDQPIRFYPTNDPSGCAGWNVVTGDPASANALKKLLEQLKAGTYDPPDVYVGDNLNYVGGTLAAAFPYMKELFDWMKTRDEDGNPETWTVVLPVYESSDCSNPGGWIKTVGFATVVITHVLEAPEKTIDGTVICDQVNPGEAKGPGDYGTIGTIPVLVK